MSTLQKKSLRTFSTEVTAGKPNLIMLRLSLMEKTTTTIWVHVIPSEPAILAV
jgi:hypothetical protein